MLPNKPTIFKKIGKIDTKPFIDFLSNDIQFLENNNYDRPLFFKGCKTFFLVEHKKIENHDLLEKFVNISDELTRILCLNYGKGISNNIQYSLISPGGNIKPHIDEGEDFEDSHRIHLPLITNPKVEFIIDGVENYFKVGELIEINNQKEHSVYNKHNSQSRLHLIIDYIPTYKPKLRH